jgi:transcriptional regulator with XRE-family HTH domain
VPTAETMEELTTDMGRRIRTMLKERAISHARAAVELGVSDQTVRNWCAGRHTPRPDQLDALARLLGVEPGWLLTGVNNLDEAEVISALRELRAKQDEILAAVLEVRRLLVNGQ